MHGKILSARDFDYGDLTSFGRVTIEKVGHDVYVTVDGFSFEDHQTGRAVATKALAWARDLLAAKVEAQRLVPGGGVVAVSGMSAKDYADELQARYKTCD